MSLLLLLMANGTVPEPPVAGGTINLLGTVESTYALAGTKDTWGFSGSNTNNITLGGISD